MSEYSHLIETGSPVRVLEGPRIGKVGIAETAWDEMVIVSIDGIEVAFRRGQLEPLFDLTEGIEIKVPAYQSGSDLYDKVKGFGMSSDDLADFCKEFILEAMGRVTGVGDKQYSNVGFQKFEGMELDQLLEYAEEEILDIPNYCAMLFIRIRRLRQALDAVDNLGKGTEEEYEEGDITADDFKDGGESEATNH